MSRRRSWNTDNLRNVVAKSTSIRQVLVYLGLIPAGGNYEQVKNMIREERIDTTHFLGMGWRKNMKCEFVPKIKLSSILKRVLIIKVIN